MDYLKIAEIANKCEVKRNQISEHYRMLGANPKFEKETQDIFYKAIENMESERSTLENKLRKLIS